MGYDVIDSRTLEDELQGYEEEHDELKEAVEEAEAELREAEHEEEPDPDLVGRLHSLAEQARIALADFEAGEDYERMLKIQELKEETEAAGWEYGIAFVTEDGFEDYAQQLAEDIGAIGQDSQWPVYCIDWERAARDLAVDYSSVTFDGVDYLYREA